MKKVLVATTLFLLVASQAFAVGVFGPARPDGPTGSPTLGFGLFYYNSEWEGNPQAEQHQVYAQAGYTLSDNLGIYAQLGGSDLEVGDFDDGFRPYGAAGFKYLVTDREPIGFGFFGQAAYFADYDDTIAGTKVEFTKMWEATFGAALHTVIEGAYLYGGPIFYAREGDVETSGASASFEEEGNIGGFVGVRWTLKTGIVIDLEAQFKKDVSAGAAVQYTF